MIAASIYYVQIAVLSEDTKIHDPTDLKLFRPPFITTTPERNFPFSAILLACNNDLPEQIAVGSTTAEKRRFEEECQLYSEYSVPDEVDLVSTRTRWVPIEPRNLIFLAYR